MNRQPPLIFAGWAGLASFAAIFVLSVCDSTFDLGGVSTLTLIGSFGATAVLLYGAPHAEFSRFRNVMYGHGLSALVGVTCALTIGTDTPVAAAMAVGLAVFLMHVTETTHPPGGATALIAVTGGERVYQLGYLYVVLPVLSGALLMCALARLSRGALRVNLPLAEERLDDG